MSRPPCWFQFAGAIAADGSQFFEGTDYNGRYFNARFTTHLLVITHKGQSNTFIAQEGWNKEEKARKELISEYIQLNL